MKSLKSECITLGAQERLHNLKVPVIGLTGGIATGKSTVSKILIEKDLPLIDADKLVKDVYATEEAIEFIRLQYPQAIQGGVIDFPSLRKFFFQNKDFKEKLEAFIYQRLPVAFMKKYKELGEPKFVFYDVPLLFEKKLDTKVDVKVVVFAPREIQKRRLMNRDNNDEEMADKILDQQMDIEEKKTKAHFVIDNSKTMDLLKKNIEIFLKQILN